jgi:hypothetical protein
MLGERDRGRKLDSSKQTLNQYLDRWLELCAKPRLRAKSLKDYEGLLRRYVRPGLGPKALASISAFDIQTLYRDLLVRSLSARSIRYTRAVAAAPYSLAFRGPFCLLPLHRVPLPQPPAGGRAEFEIPAVCVEACDALEPHPVKPG